MSCTGTVLARWWMSWCKNPSLTLEIDDYSYKKFPDKNSGFKNLEKSGRIATLTRYFLDACEVILLNKILGD